MDLTELKKINEFLTRKIKFKDEQGIKTSKDIISSKQYLFEFNNKIKKRKLTKKSKYMITPREVMTVTLKGNANSKSGHTGMKISKENFNIKSSIDKNKASSSRQFDSLRLSTSVSFTIERNALSLNQINFEDDNNITKSKKQITFAQPSSPFFDTINVNDQFAKQAETKSNNSSYKFGLKSFKSFNMGSSNSIRLRKGGVDPDQSQPTDANDQLLNEKKKTLVQYFNRTITEKENDSLSYNLSKLYKTVKIGKIKSKLNNSSIDVTDFTPWKPNQRTSSKRAEKENSGVEIGENAKVFSPMFPPNSIPIKIMKNLMKNV